MDDDRAKGGMKQMKGSLKEGAGRVLGIQNSKPTARWIAPRAAPELHRRHQGHVPRPRT
jgi:hypothetical protein